MDSIWPYLAVYIKIKEKGTFGIVFLKNENELFVIFLQSDGETQRISPNDEMAVAMMLTGLPECK